MQMSPLLLPTMRRLMPQPTVDQNQQVAPVDTTVPSTIQGTTTVRVNGLANPYVVMNLIASTVECVCVAAGALFLWRGLAQQAPALDPNSKQKTFVEARKAFDWDCFNVGRAGYAWFPSIGFTQRRFHQEVSS